jgi:hypothetical protein
MTDSISELVEIKQAFSGNYRIYTLKSTITRWVEEATEQILLVLSRRSWVICGIENPKLPSVWSPNNSILNYTTRYLYPQVVNILVV